MRRTGGSGRSEKKLKKKWIGLLVIIVVVAMIFGVFFFQRFTPDSSGSTSGPERHGTVPQEIYGRYHKKSYRHMNLVLYENGEFLVSPGLSIEGKYRIEGDEIIFYDFGWKDSWIEEGAVVKGKIRENKIVITDRSECPEYFWGTFSTEWVK